MSAPVAEPASPPDGPLHLTATVLAMRRAGAYVAMTLVAPGVAERFRPGQFLAVTVGGQDTSLLLRRAFSISVARFGGGGYPGTVEIVFAVRGRGTAWLAERAPEDRLDVVAPLGRSFGLPDSPVPCVLVGGGYGSSPLLGLAEALRERGCRAHFVLGAATQERLFGAREVKGMAASLTVTTEDASAGERGRVTDVLPDLVERSGAQVVYACGPMGMLRAVAAVAAEHGLASQVAVEEAMACGIGVCMTCVLPVVGDDGITRMTRTCVEGPVFAGERVRWDDVGTVPPDCLGAEAMGAGGGAGRDGDDARAAALRGEPRPRAAGDAG